MCEKSHPLWNSSFAYKLIVTFVGFLLFFGVSNLARETLLGVKLFFDNLIAKQICDDFSSKLCCPVVWRSVSRCNAKSQLGVTFVKLRRQISIANAKFIAPWYLDTSPAVISCLKNYCSRSLEFLRFDFLFREEDSFFFVIYCCARASKHDLGILKDNGQIKPNWMPCILWNS